jgi:hypothetical protein
LAKPFLIYEVLFILNIWPVEEDIPDVVFAIQTSQGIALGLLANITIILSFTLELKLIIGSAIGSTFGGGSGCSKHRKAFVVEPYIY